MRNPPGRSSTGFIRKIKLFPVVGPILNKMDFELRPEMGSLIILEGAKCVESLV